MYNNYPDLNYFSNHSDIHFNMNFAQYLIDTKTIFSFLGSAIFILSAKADDETKGAVGGAGTEAGGADPEN